jgi:hypothetical protein
MRLCSFFFSGPELIFAREHQPEALMANREQRSNKEKKKPKASDKDKQAKGAPPPFVQPELVRKPHKGKDWS